MALSDPITIRLPQHKRREYQDEAAARGQTIGPYLRSRLEREDSTRNEIAELRGLMVELLREFDQVRQTASGAGAGQGVDPGIALEALLLLRTIVSPDKATMVQREVERQGLAVWTGEKGART